MISRAKGATLSCSLNTGTTTDSGAVLGLDQSTGTPNGLDVKAGWDRPSFSHRLDPENHSALIRISKRYRVIALRFDVGPNTRPFRVLTDEGSTRFGFCLRQFHGQVLVERRVEPWPRPRLDRFQRYLFDFRIEVQAQP